ncbi:hypothetical protein M422DRAFT_47183 [Sphaerobolus stellatus SS14]|uniref:Unplaced genomic scaffold SPHSTscaffold_40, whole genome shotgun sequence n=1 Tax=Sphaerobolus stellatus (strain SS14) TaxID=990650 RepID=A0A0C9VCW3_SPHS4|nr:hypothetical protein M422DRAFT_47183 [Sphaerobolus stellatus SS14]
MALQKALVLPEAHGNFEIADVAIPKPGKGEILIHSTTLNPVDCMILKYGFTHLIKDYPAILGLDSVGVVEEAGEGVTKFQKGDKAFHEGDFNTKVGTFQQYTIVFSEFVAKIPSNLSFDQVASIPLCIMTAAVGYYLETGAGLQAPWDGGKDKYNG